jgi:uncharacterized protein
MAADVLVVMARHPTPGAVKTRLARAIGAERACALYRAFLTDIAATYDTGAWSLVWAVTPADADLRPFVGAAARQIAQRGDGLAVRMRNTFVDLFAAGASRVVMIGADVPHLGAARIADAFVALDTNDAVFTPTRDGGYCLVGLARPFDLFSGVVMGTEAVFVETLAQVEALRLRAVQQDATFDVDRPEDLEELAALIASGAVTLPATAAVLAG